MLERTRQLWEKQNRLVGDRAGLFGAIVDAVQVSTVLYPGSYVDITPSLIWSAVTYIEVDRRAEQFFSDEAGTKELLVEHGVDPDRHKIQFIAADYTSHLGLAEGSFDLLVSLYAGFISEHCTRYLRPGGFLLVNPSHGDAAMASLDARYRLRGVVDSQAGRYSVRTSDLSTDLVPQSDIDVTIELLHETGRGVAYTKTPFAYLFERAT